jgi:hypothetical protein
VTRSHATVMIHCMFSKKKKKRVVTENGIRAVNSRDIGKRKSRIGTRF